MPADQICDIALPLRPGISPRAFQHTATPSAPTARARSRECEHRQPSFQASWQDQNNVSLGASLVRWSWTAIPELLDEYSIYTSGSTLYDACSLEGICQRWIARPWRSDQQIIQPYTLRETTGIGDLNSVLVPLHVHAAKPGVIAVN
jgi:hypothetical protein